MATRPGGKAPLGTAQTPKFAVAKAKPRQDGRFTPTGGKTITATSTGGPSTGGKSIGNYYNSAKPGSGGSAPKTRKPLPSAPPATPTRAGGGAPPRQYTGGKFVPGYTPPGFGSGQHQRQDFDDNSESEHEDVDSEEEEEEAQREAQSEYDDDDEYDDLGVKVKKEPKLGDQDSEFHPDEEFEDVNDEDADMDYTVVEEFNLGFRGSNSTHGRGGRSAGGSTTARGSYSTNKVHYKKKIRKDSSRFTTTTAMIDADDEFHPKVAAFMGRKIVGTGNGRKGGRKLIRWTPATDQLLLLCFHHELAMMRDDLPYEQVAERMFPEKCATGGAVKERFAKLRIEMLNRGSWVPPIIGKSPQGIRPNVRGVVRVAPGVDKGRYVLWKEDASKLIDPKDVMKGYAAAQAKGLEAPGRVWISNEAKKEFFTKKAELESRGLRPLADVPVDNDEDDEGCQEGEGASGDEHRDEENEDDLITPIPPIATPNRKRKLQGAQTPASKKSTAAKNRGRKTQAIEDDDVFGPGQGDGSPRLRTRTARNKGKGAASANKASCRNGELLANGMRAAAPSPEANQSLRGGDLGGDLGGNMMSFEPQEKTYPVRRVLILAQIPTRALAKFPPGQSGPGSEKYFLDEVLDQSWAGKRNPEAEMVVEVQAMQVHDANKPKSLNEDPDHVLFNSGITPPSDDPFWNEPIDIAELMATADKIVDEVTRPADMIKQVFDGKRFWNVDEVTAEYKANTSPETGMARDINIWYRCATILRHATMGEQYDAAKVDKTDLIQAPVEQSHFQQYNFLPDQNSMASLNRDANANANGMSPFQTYGFGSPGSANQLSLANQSGFMQSGDFSHLNAGTFTQNDMGMSIVIFDQGGQNNEAIFHPGDIEIGGMNHFGAGNMGGLFGLPDMPPMTEEQISDFLEFSGQNPVDGGNEASNSGVLVIKAEDERSDVQLN